MRGQFVVSAADIRASQQVFFTYGPQRRDLGNGGYLEPDFAASHVLSVVRTFGTTRGVN